VFSTLIPLKIFQRGKCHNGSVGGNIDDDKKWHS